MQALAPGGGRRGNFAVQRRNGKASCSAATASSACSREEKGPEYVAPSGWTSRTTDSRGKASTVSLSQGARSGRRERRLYGGQCSAISRISRTRASNAVAHGTGLTLAA